MKKDRDPLERAILGALKNTVKIHGPIGPELIGSAAKRIVGEIRSLQAQGMVKFTGSSEVTDVG